MSTKTLILAVSGALLTGAGCSTYEAPRTALEVSPASAVRHSGNRNDALYAVGRYYQGQIRYDKAIDAYRTLIDENPAHAEAHNALAVIYSLQGQHDLAVIGFKAALAAAPGAAHIHNNLGYEYLRQGRFEEAGAALQEAMRLDPASSRAADNLREVRTRLAAEGRSESYPPATQAHSGPVAAPVSPQPSVAASLEKSVSLAAVAETPALAPPVETAARSDAASGMRLANVAPQVYELQLPQHPAATPSPRPLAEPGKKAGRVEVANGNGVDGLARRAGALLLRAGYDHPRVTNQKPYQQRLTEIQFRPGFESQAEQLSRMFSGTKGLTRSTALRSDIAVRVVLGKDLRSTAQMAELETGLAQMAALDADPTIR